MNHQRANTFDVTVGIDLDRMQRALASNFHELPRGLSREEKRAHFLAAAKRVKEGNGGLVHR